MLDFDAGTCRQEDGIFRRWNVVDVNPGSEYRVKAPKYLQVETTGRPKAISPRYRVW